MNEKPIEFDGRYHARLLRQKIKDKKGQKRKAVLASIIWGSDLASIKYTNIKKKVASDIGFEMRIFQFAEDSDLKKIKEKISELNKSDEVDGVMIQLPLPMKQKKYTDELIEKIKPAKDVDGLRKNSKFLSPVTLAVAYAFDLSQEYMAQNPKIAVVGAGGRVGRKICDYFSKHDLIPVGSSGQLKKLKEADVVISATGKSDVIGPEYLSQGVVIIDVGAPKPEFKKDCYKLAHFYTPVPGGIGPMTVAFLMKNLSEKICKI